MGKLRTFVAVEIDRAIKGRFGNLQKKLKEAGGDVKWVEVENIHVTLKFLGHIDDTDLPLAKDIIKVAVANLDPFFVKFKGVGAFPRPERPRVLTIAIQDTSGSLSRINSRLEQGFFEKLGIKKDGRRYSPHLTLGRVKSTKNIDPLVQLMARHSADDFGEEWIKRVVLMHSQLSPKGPTYIRLENFNLDQ
ncbi:MAG: RNA 2',3'-cyclic phosphodiesterase [Candidatus Brocadiales bacterium]